MGMPQQSVRARLIVDRLNSAGEWVEEFYYVKTITVEKVYNREMKVADNSGTGNFAADTGMAPAIIALKSKDLPVYFKFGGAAADTDPNVEAMLMVCSTGEFVVATQPAIHLLNDAPNVTTPAGGNDALVQAFVAGDDV
jgi:hypothetical protein